MALSSPPHIDTKLPAFSGTTIRIPFSLGRTTARADFNYLKLRLKTTTGNITKYDDYTNEISYDPQTQNYYALFRDSQNKFANSKGQFFKAQIAFVNGAYNTDTSPKFIETSSSAWSSVGIIKCTKIPDTSISNLTVAVDNINLKEYTGTYKNEDTTEKVYSYNFTIYDPDNNILETSGELIHNTSNDEVIYDDTAKKNYWSSNDTWQSTAELKDGVKYRIVYKIKTMNDFDKETSPYIIKNSSTVDANFPAKLLADVDNDNGCVSLSLIKPKELKEAKPITGNFVISRYSENLQTWNEVCRFNMLSQYPESIGTLWTDYTIEHGVKYLYCIQAYNSNGLYSNRIYHVIKTENDYKEFDEDGNPYYVFTDFEDAFLTDENRQLKIKFNPKVSSFKPTILESKVDTLGGKYPFIFRNGNVEYREFPISGLLSYLGDEKELFMNGVKPEADELKRGKTAAAGGQQLGVQSNRFDNIPESGTKLTSDNFYRERQFKMEALDWLTNGQPKLFRSPGEGSYIVRLMNVSLTPNDTVGRMLHTFNATAYEIADYSFKNLKYYNLLHLPDGENRTMKYVEIKLSEKGSTYQPGYDMYNASILDASPGTVYKLYFNKSDSATITIGATGAYYINTDDSQLTKIEKVSGDVNNTATLTYGYYDTTVPDSFSYIQRIVTTDEVSQFIGEYGKEDVNIITDKIEDIRREAGHFYQITAQVRPIITVYENKGSYYEDSKYTRPVTPVATNIYLCKGIYYSGKPGENSLGTTPPETYFKLNDKYIIDLATGNTYGPTPAAGQITCITQGRYWVDTDFGKISALHLSPGAYLDVSYELKTIEYTIESTNAAVKTAKETWIKNPTQTNYRNYISTLESQLAKENVYYAI